jgi:hypothetical protein
MRSPVIKETEGQLTLSFEPGLAERYTCLRECVAAGVYRNGLGNTAIDLDVAPGNLSVQLSSDPSRHFSVDSLERYIEKTGDTTPIHYLIDKFLRASTAQDELATLLPMLRQMVPAMKKAGLV